METSHYDLIVAGAGPAGSACAITAARGGVRVLLLEKDRFPRHKVCGEFVSPESLGLLEWLLEGRHFEANMAIHASRLFYRRQSATLPLATPARSIARFDLDQELLLAAQHAGARVEEGMTVQKVEANGTFTVTASGKTLTARAVVNATGRWSQLTRRTQGGEKWLGLKAHFREPSPPPSVDLYFFDGGYCGVTPMTETTVNACALVKADVARTLDDVLAMHPALQERSRSWQPVFPPLTTSNLHFHPPVTECDGMVLAGDAAAFIDPYTGDGISLALHSGTLAARSLLPFFQDQCTLEQARRNYRDQYFECLSPAFRHSAWVRRVLTAPHWVRSLVLKLAATGPVSRALFSSTRVRDGNWPPRRVKEHEPV